MRARGSGQVFYDSTKKRWLVRLKVGVNLNGKAQYVTRTTATDSQARDLLSALRREHDTGLLSSDARQTFGDFAQHYFNHAATQRLRPHVLQEQRRQLNKHLLPVLGKKPLKSISTEDLEGLLYALREHLSANSVNTLRRILTRLFNEAVNRNYLLRNPVGPIRQFKPRTGEISAVCQPLNHSEVLALLNAAKGDQLQLFITLSLATGARLGEVLGLHWDDIDSEQQTLHIQRTLREGARTNPGLGPKTEVSVGATKTEASNRVIWLSPEILELLNRHRDVERAKRFTAGAAWVNSGAVFTNDLGSHVRPSTVRNQYEKFVKKHNLRYVRIHDLRHTYATLALNNGQRIEQIQQALGHESIVTTKNIYGRHAQQLAEDSAKGMADLLFQDSRSMEKPQQGGLRLVR